MLGFIRVSLRRAGQRERNNEQGPERRLTTPDRNDETKDTECARRGKGRRRRLGPGVAAPHSTTVSQGVTLDRLEEGRCLRYAERAEQYPADRKAAGQHAGKCPARIRKGTL